MGKIIEQKTYDPCDTRVQKTAVPTHGVQGKLPFIFLLPPLIQSLSS